MSHNVKVRATYSAAGIDASIDTELADVALMRLYDGTQPATPETALGGGNHQLSEHTATPAAASSGSAAIAIADDTDADRAGTAAWGSLCKSDGTRIVDFTVGTTGCDLNLDTVSVELHGLVHVSSFTYSRA